MLEGLSQGDLFAHGLFNLKNNSKTTYAWYKLETFKVLSTVITEKITKKRFLKRFCHFQGVSSF